MLSSPPLSVSCIPLFLSVEMNTRWLQVSPPLCSLSAAILWSVGNELTTEWGNSPLPLLSFGCFGNFTH